MAIAKACVIAQDGITKRSERWLQAKKRSECGVLNCKKAPAEIVMLALVGTKYHPRT